MRHAPTPPVKSGVTTPSYAGSAGSYIDIMTQLLKQMRGIQATARRTSLVS